MIQTSWSYLEQGGPSKPTLLFIHGTGGDYSDFKRQVEYFSPRYHVIAIDLPAHGDTPKKPDQDFSVTGLAQEVGAFVKEKELSHVILVGHSLGGMIAMEIASHRPDWVKGIVLLDAPILIPAPIAAGVGQFTSKFLENYPDAIEEFAAKFFFSPDDSPANRTRLTQRLRAFDPDTFMKIWESSVRFDAETALLRIEAPLLFIHSTVPTDLGRYTGLRPDSPIVRTFASGHYAQIEVPEQVNGFIEAFVSKVAYPDQAQLKIETMDLPRKVSA